MKNFNEAVELYNKYLRALEAQKQEEDYKRFQHWSLNKSADFDLGNQYDKEEILKGWQEDMISKGWSDWIIELE